MRMRRADAANNPRVPVLRRFVFGIADGKDRRSDSLPRKLSYFAIAKRLPERGKPLEVS